MKMVIGFDAAMTSRAFALALGFVVTTAPAQGLLPPTRDAGAGPIIVIAAGPATTETGPGFPAAALPRLTQCLARPDAIEIRKIVLEFFDKGGAIGPSKARVLMTYLTKHSEQLEDFRLELNAFQELSEPNKNQKDAARRLVAKLQIVKAQEGAAKAKEKAAKAEEKAAKAEEKAAKAEEKAAKAEEKADKSQKRAETLSRFANLLAPNK